MISEIDAYSRTEEPDDESSVCDTMGVNYNTIHKVYQDLETDGLILSGRGKRSTIAEIDREALSLPDSPVDVVIEELVRVVRETGVSHADAMTRIEEAFAKLEDR